MTTTRLSVFSSQSAVHPKQRTFIPYNIMASIISAWPHLHILAVIRLVGHVGVGAEVAVERRELERLVLLPPFTGLVPIGSLLALSEFIITCNPNPLLSF